MTNAVIGSLRVDLSSNTAELDSAIASAKGVLSSFAAVAKVHLGEVATGFAQASSDGGAQFQTGLENAATGLKSFITGAFHNIIRNTLGNTIAGAVMFASGPIGALYDELEKLGATLLHNHLFDNGQWEKIALFASNVADQVADAFMKMGEIFSAVWDHFWKRVGDANGLIHLFALLVTDLLGWAFQGPIRAVQAWSASITEAFTSATSWFDAIKNALHAAIIVPFETATKAVQAWWGSVEEAMQGAETETGKTLVGIRAAIVDPFLASTLAAQKTEEELGVFGKKVKAHMNEAKKGVEDLLAKKAGLTKDDDEAIENDKTKDSYEKVIETIKKKITASQTEILTIGKTKVEQIRLRMQLEATNRLKAIGITLSAAQKAELDKELSGLSAVAAALESAETSHKNLNKVKETFLDLSKKVTQTNDEIAAMGMLKSAAYSYRLEAETIEQLKKDGIVLSEQQLAQLRTEIDLVSQSSLALEQKKLTMGALREASDALQGAFVGVFEKMVEGTFKARDALRELLKSLMRIALNQVWINLLGGAQTGGNIFGALASLLGGGGGRELAYSSPGAGPSGGAGPLHAAFAGGVPSGRMESGGSSDKGYSLYMPISIDASGAYPESIGELRRELSSLERSIPTRVVSAVHDARERRRI